MNGDTFFFIIINLETVRNFLALEKCSPGKRPFFFCRNQKYLPSVHFGSFNQSLILFYSISFTPSYVH